MISTNPVIRNTSPLISVIKNGSLFTQDVDTVEAGDSVHYDLNGYDSQTLSNLVTPQTVTLTAYSPHFGANFTDTLNGCVVPPCATLLNASPNSSPVTIGNTLLWKTSCAHAGWEDGCLKHYRKFQFIFKANDDFCPVNGVSFRSIDIVVRGPKIYFLGNSMLLSNPNGIIYSIQWYLNGVAIPGATDTIYTPSQNGIYSLIAKTSGGCEMLSNALMIGSATGLNESNATINNLNLNYDGNGNLNIALQSTNDLQTEILVQDSKGSKVYSNILRIVNGSQHLLLNPGKLAEGLYIVTLINAKTKLSSKFIVSRN